MPSYHCPFCGHHAIISEDGQSTNAHYFEGGGHGQQKLVSEATVCPNANCREYKLRVTLYDMRFNGEGYEVVTPARSEWTLRPAADAKVFPEYVPAPIRADYVEACLTRDSSPKASATLARRCLQGILRDFWAVKPGRLVDEINQLEGKIDPLALQAIHAIRKIGNIGAHMEGDVNVIIEVDDGEARLLIQLIETLVQEWYVARHARQSRMAAVIAAAEAKKPTKRE